VPTTLGIDRFVYSRLKILILAIYLCVPLFAQDQSLSDAPSISPPTPLDTTRKKWNNSLHETASLLTLGGGTFNATFSQLTNTDPQYGTDGAAFGKRFAASFADIAAQNFFGDFLMASAFHEDPHYVRMGPGHSFWHRTGYAISRALIIRNDNGGNGFNFDNILGSALSTGFSNLYYPAPSRTRNANLSHFVIDVADNGFVNLAPEFWPDFRGKVLRRHHRHEVH
jgi:hypothetical protein